MEISAVISQGSIWIAAGKTHLKYFTLKSMKSRKRFKTILKSIKWTSVSTYTAIVKITISFAMPVNITLILAESYLISFPGRTKDFICRVAPLDWLKTKSQLLGQLLAESLSLKMCWLLRYLDMERKRASLFGNFTP